MIVYIFPPLNAEKLYAFLSYSLILALSMGKTCGLLVNNRIMAKMVRCTWLRVVTCSHDLRF